LGTVIQKIGAAVYEQQPNVPESEAGPNPNPEAGPDVVEGEVKE
jgi:hypothetical protein